MSLKLANARETIQQSDCNSMIDREPQLKCHSFFKKTKQNKKCAFSKTLTLLMDRYLGYRAQQNPSKVQQLSDSDNTEEIAETLAEQTTCLWEQ